SPRMVAWTGSSSRIWSQKRVASSSTAGLVSVRDTAKPQIRSGASRECTAGGGDGSGPEQVGQQRRRCLLELVVPAVGGRLVRPPALEGGAVSESVTLEVIEGHLGDELGAQRLPGEVLAAVPAAGGARQPPTLCGCLLLPL